jgi:hypothetical protein
METKTTARCKELTDLQMILSDAATRAQELYGRDVKIRLAIDGLPDSLICKLGEVTGEFVWCADDSEAKMIRFDMGKDELTLHNSKLPF